jgi:hypothetical protein
MRDLSIKSKEFYCKDLLIATGYTRLVKGGRGNYIEFDPISIIKENIQVAKGHEYRLTDKWKKIVYFAWYNPLNSDIKIYYQYKTVDYADYLIGYYYIAPKDLDYEGELYSE